MEGETGHQRLESRVGVVLLASQEDASLGMALPAHPSHCSGLLQQFQRERREGWDHLKGSSHRSTALLSTRHCVQALRGHISSKVKQSHLFVDCRIRVFQLQFSEEKVIVLVHESRFLVCG